MNELNSNNNINDEISNHQTEHTDHIAFNEHEHSQDSHSSHREKTPEQFIDEIFNIAHQLDVFKKELKTEHNYLTNKIFKLLGYRYSSIIANSNFFHYATQAIIVDIFRQLILKPDQNKNFKKVLEYVKASDIKQDAYLDTIEILLGSDLLPVDRKNGLIFLAKIDSSRKKVLAKIPDEISQKMFEESIMSIFKEAVNATLNESIESKNSKNYLSKFNELTEENLGTICIDAYTESFDDDLRQSGETFFNFANCSFLELIKDLHEFNKYSNSLFYQIKFVVLKNIRSITHLISNLLHFSHNKLNQVLITLHLGKIAELYTLCADFAVSTGKASLCKVQDLKQWLDDAYTNEMNKLNINYNELKEYSNTKYTVLKAWVDSSFMAVPLKLPFLLSEKAIEYTGLTKSFLIEKVYTPIHGVTFTYGGTAVNFIIKQSEKVKENTKTLCTNISEKIATLYSDVKETVLTGKDSLFKITSDEHYLVISVN